MGTLLADYLSERIATCRQLLTEAKDDESRKLYTDLLNRYRREYEALPQDFLTRD